MLTHHPPGPVGSPLALARRGFGSHGEPLAPCRIQRARELIKAGRVKKRWYHQGLAAIQLKDRSLADAQPAKIDVRAAPAVKTTGVAVVMNTPTEDRVVFQQEIAAHRLCGTRAHRRPTTTESPATDPGRRRRGRGHDRNGDQPRTRRPHPCRYARRQNGGARRETADDRGVSDPKGRRQAPKQRKRLATAGICR